MEPQHFTDLMHTSQTDLLPSDLVPSAPCHRSDNIYAEVYFMYSVYMWYQKVKARREIKRKLKVVVNLSNDIQDENNKLQDMKDAWEPMRKLIDQRMLIGDLCAQQYRAIKELERAEMVFPEERNNRFFYF